MKQATCSSCRHWLGTTTVSIRGDGEAIVTTLPGQCRALPPQFSYGWPETRAEDWCGQHEGRHPQAEELYPIREGVR